MSAPLIDAIRAVTGNDQLFITGSAAFAPVAARYGAIADARTNLVALARPADAAQLSAIVKLARTHKAAVLTLYNGSDVGASLSGEGDCIAIDLSRMNRVLEVNPDYAFARVEPGVSFADLARYLGEQKLPLLVDAERDSNASVAGSIFSKGMGFTPYADHALVQCGGEFVLPDGAVVRTGMGAMPDSRTWQIYKFALGPFSDGIAIQSAGMIPTQVGIWLMGKPPAVQGFAFDLADDAALATALEHLRPFKLNNMLAGTIAITHRAFDAARASVPSERGEWRLFGAFYGLPATVSLMAPMLESGLAGLDGCRKVAPEALADDPVWREQLSLMSGGLGSSAPRFRESGGNEAARLTFVAPIEGDAARAMMAAARAALKAHDLPLLTELSLCGRSLFQTLHLPYAAGQPQNLAKMADCTRQLVADLGKAGFGLASESIELSKVALQALGDSPLRQVQQRIMAAAG